MPKHTHSIPTHEDIIGHGWKHDNSQRAFHEENNLQAPLFFDIEGTKEIACRIAKNQAYMATHEILDTLQGVLKNAAKDDVEITHKDLIEYIEIALKRSIQKPVSECLDDSLT